MGVQDGQRGAPVLMWRSRIRVQAIGVEVEFQVTGGEPQRLLRLPRPPRKNRSSRLRMPGLTIRRRMMMAISS
jgi:hypothetical protein